MGIECDACRQPVTTIRFRRPDGPAPKAVKWLRGLLLVGALLSLANLVQVFALFTGLGELGDQVVAELAPENSAPGEDVGGEVRDMFRVYANFAWSVAIVLLAALVALLVRYGLLLTRGIKQGHPRTLGQIRSIGRLQLGLAFAMYAGIAAIFSGLETMQVEPSLGTGVFLGGAVLWLAKRPSVKAYFSDYQVAPAPALAPAPAPVAGESPA